MVDLRTFQCHNFAVVYLAFSVFLCLSYLHLIWHLMPLLLLVIRPHTHSSGFARYVLLTVISFLLVLLIFINTTPWSLYSLRLTKNLLSFVTFFVHKLQYLEGSNLNHCVYTSMHHCPTFQTFEHVGRYQPAIGIHKYNTIKLLQP